LRLLRSTKVPKKMPDPAKTTANLSRASVSSGSAGSSNVPWLRLRIETRC
jgi:hypothetical protein